MKNDMPRDIDPIGGKIKTTISRIIETITQKRHRINSWDEAWMDCKALTKENIDSQKDV